MTREDALIRKRVYEVLFIDRARLPEPNRISKTIIQDGIIKLEMGTLPPLVVSREANTEWHGRTQVMFQSPDRNDWLLLANLALKWNQYVEYEEIKQ